MLKTAETTLRGWAATLAPKLEDACLCPAPLQMGDMRQGRSLAMQISSQQLFKECGHILEGWVLGSGV